MTNIDERILQAIKSEILGGTFENVDVTELKEEINNFELKGYDYIDIEGEGEYRIIFEEDIEDIYYDETVETIKDCYNLDVPDFVEINWEQTVKNCLVDWYGHHFSGYDGSELETDWIYLFRTN